MAMTHDELLANIESNNYRQSRTLDTSWAALRAVVELHKEQSHKSHKDNCWACSLCEGCSKPYPCETIQAIEKELG